jgi:LPXTG-motif cell wall-anchored protein
MLFLSFCEVTSTGAAHSPWALLGGAAALITAIATLVRAFRNNSNSNDNNDNKNNK